MATTLPIIADGILSSDHFGDILSSVGTIRDYAEHGCSTDISHYDAIRIRRSCLSYLASEDKTSNVYYQMVTEPLTGDANEPCVRVDIIYSAGGIMQSMVDSYGRIVTPKFVQMRTGHDKRVSILLPRSSIESPTNC